MGKGFLTYASAVILQAVASGYLYGFDIIDITGMPGGTVYPALRRLQEAGYLVSKWEKQSIAEAQPRPARKYYDLTRDGQQVLAEAVKRYRLLEQTQPNKRRNPTKDATRNPHTPEAKLCPCSLAANSAFPDRT